MIFDTDEIIWVQRGNVNAAKAITTAPTRFIALQTYLELLQCSPNKSRQQAVRRFLRDYDFRILPLSAEIGSRAATLVETYSLSHDMKAGDALIASTALENEQVLCTSNIKHFRQIPLLELNKLSVE